MKIRAKMILSTAAVALSCALLAGCGGSSSSSAPAASSQAASSVASSAVSEAASATAEGTNGTDALDDAVNTLLDTNPISNQFEIAAMNIEYDFGIQADDITSYKGVKSHVTSHATAAPVKSPNASWRIKSRTAEPPLTLPVIADSRITVIMYANGSLLPLSNSSMDAVPYLRFSLRERRIENTDAASVDPRTAPRSIPSISAILSTR